MAAAILVLALLAGAARPPSDRMAATGRQSPAWHSRLLGVQQGAQGVAMPRSGDEQLTQLLHRTAAACAGLGAAVAAPAPAAAAASNVMALTDPALSRSLSLIKSNDPELTAYLGALLASVGALVRMRCTADWRPRRHRALCCSLPCRQPQHCVHILCWHK